MRYTPVAGPLAAAGIESRNLFPPLDTLPAGRARRRPTPVATRLARKGISLPLFAGIEERDIDQIVETIRKTI